MSDHVTERTSVAWAGQLPLSWEERRGKFLFQRLRLPTHQNDGVVTAFRDGQVTLRENRRVDGFTFAEKEIGYQGVEEGNLVIHSMDGFAGAIGVAEASGKCSPVCVVCKPRQDADCRFFGYVLRHMALSGYIMSLAKGIRERSTSFGWGEFSEQWLPLPSLPTQKTIADYLDRKTAAIDTLIEKKEKLIALLAEKRAALIDRAVTKGLNPEVPMKDSGIDYLGQIPKHWQVAALKYLVSTPIIDGPHVTPDSQSEGIPFVSAQAISKGFIDFDKKWGYISREDHRRFSRRYRPLQGDILLVKLGATTGVPALVETDAEFSIWVPLAAIRLRQRIQPKFIFNVLRSSSLRVAYELNWTYGTQQTLGLGTISNLPMPLPPEEERQNIVNYLDATVPAIEALERTTASSAERLREYRQALITAAVTGQIEVSSEVTP